MRYRAGASAPTWVRRWSCCCRRCPRFCRCSFRLNGQEFRSQVCQCPKHFANRFEAQISWLFTSTDEHLESQPWGDGLMFSATKILPNVILEDLVWCFPSTLCTCTCFNGILIPPAAKRDGSIEKEKPSS